MWLLLHVSCLLWLAQAGHVLQRFKNEDGLQREISPELPVIYQKEVDMPFILQEKSVLKPRGSRSQSRCQGRRSCGGITHQRNTLIDFPPGRPTESNIDNICELSRVKSSYGPHNLPETGFGHLSRQGNAVNQMEEGFTACCLQTERLGCAQQLWQDVLNKFCEEEFSIKTRPYLCCTEYDSSRYSCFENEAPYPNYDSPAPPSMRRASNLGPCSSAGTSVTSECQSMDEALENKITEIFPPGEPNADSFENICRLRKVRSSYLMNSIPQSYNGQQQRQAKAINQLESQFKKCCKNEDVSCAHDAWEKVLKEFCDDEFSVKTRHYECCQEETSTAMYSCFSSKAPHPNYDREIRTLNLRELHDPVLQQLCGEIKLLSKQKQIPLLVKDITEDCCGLSDEDRVGCAEQKKEDFIEILCTTNQSSWKDSQKCCQQEDRVSCFNTNYLNKVSIAVAAATSTDSERN